MDTQSIIRQSKTAYQQWCVQWRAHAKEHAKYPMKSFDEFSGIGIGKAVVCVANGYSFEENIELLKKHQKNVDIMACDKTLGHLLNHGITPKYVLVCDANVSYEKYMKPWEDQLQNTILIQNVCGNPKWTHNGNWLDRFFFVNMDVMNYEKEFSELSGCKNLITAGTNVSNMMVVALTQSDNVKRQNLFGYDKIILLGFDYSWKFGGKYYAFDQDGGGKFAYMKHIYGLSASGKLIYTSNNLNASGQWLATYIDAFRLPIVQCSRDSLMTFGRIGDLESNLKYRYRTSDRDKVSQALKQKAHLETQIKKIHDSLKDISKAHYYAHLATV